VRPNYRQVLPEAPSAMLGLERVAHEGLTDRRLLTSRQGRASQINCCAYSVSLHSGEARTAGETDGRLDMVAVWREADCFGRAAFALCDALPLLPLRVLLAWRVAQPHLGAQVEDLIGRDPRLRHPPGQQQLAPVAGRFATSNHSHGASGGDLGATTRKISPRLAKYALRRP